MTPKDFFSELLDRLGRNSFRITFIFIWCIENWMLVFTLFNFDNTCGLQCRLDIISKYFQEHDIFGYLLLWPLLSTFTSILLYQISKFISQFIYSAYQDIAYPAVLKIVSKGKKVVPITLYEELETQKNQYAEYYLKYRKLHTDALTEIENKEKIISNRSNNNNAEVDKLRKIVFDLEKSNSDLNYRLSFARKSIDEGLPVPSENDIRLIKKYFPSKSIKFWKVGRGNLERNEEFNIIDNVYYIGDKPAFWIFNFTESGRNIRFEKISLINNVHLVNELSLSTNQYIGIEHHKDTPNQTIDIRYEKSVKDLA